MRYVALFLKQLVIAFLLCSVFPDTKCHDIKFTTFDLEGKQLFVINDVGISSKYELGTLKAETICNNTNKCINGGTCFNNVCICLPGTSGPLCQIINSCSDLNCGKDRSASCGFDEKNFQAFCKCPWGQEFDYDEHKCKDCLCDDCKEGNMCFAQVKCEFIRGEKTCTCRLPYHKFNPKKKICELCSCGDNAESCDFDDDGNQQCACKYDYAQKSSWCAECKCHNGNGCKFVKYDKVCSCQAGYVQVDGDCYKCKCGENGKCIWSTWKEQTGCICDPGFTEINGICKDISECYCGENSNCTVMNNEKICSCQEGFNYVNGLCADINECDNPKVCPQNKRCINLIGSYNCTCAFGFQPSEVKDGECEDIDECQDKNPCTDSNTECFNTVGSFKCICKSGFATRTGVDASPICEDKSSWKLGFGLLIGIFLAIIVGLVILIYRKS